MASDRLFLSLSGRNPTTGFAGDFASAREIDRNLGVAILTF